MAGIGLDSFVAHSFDKMKTRGLWTYVWATIVNFIRLKPFHITIKVPGEEDISEDLFVASIANTRQYGNNAFIAPDATPNDGKIVLVLIKPFPKIISPALIFRLFTKSLNKSKYVRTLKTEKDITIISDETRFHIDGEPVTISGEVVVRIKKDALNVLKTKYLKTK